MGTNRRVNANTINHEVLSEDFILERYLLEFIFNAEQLYLAIVFHIIYEIHTYILLIFIQFIVT